jgi:multidrug resistance protein
MTASIFLPAVPAIAEDLDTTPTIVNVTIALFIVSIGTAPLFWSPLSGFYGRRPIYLASAPIMLVSSIGVAFSRTVPQLIVTRILQGVGSSSVLSVGAGSIGDMYRPTERSNAMGWFYTGAVLGPSISPILGAALTEYTAQSWRSTQYFLVGCSALSVVLTYFFLPETMHPPTAHQKLCEQRGKRFVPFIFNPLAILGLFAWPNISCITFISSATMLMTYVLLIPITSAFVSFDEVELTVVGTIWHHQYLHPGLLFSSQRDRQHSRITHHRTYVLR